MKLINIQYIAGFFDGEGCIIAFKRNDSAKGHGYYRCEISITNTNKKLLQIISQNIDGIIYKHDKKPIPNRKPCYTLRLSSKKSYFALCELSPYLIDKKEQAEIALEYLEYKFTWANQCKDYKIDEYYVKQIQQLKRKIYE